MQRLNPSTLVMADRAHDTHSICPQIEGQGAVQNISSKRTRRRRSCLSSVLYHDPTATERMFRRLKNCRHTESRYNKLPTNLYNAISFAAAISYWSRARTPVRAVQ